MDACLHCFHEHCICPPKGQDPTDPEPATGPLQVGVQAPIFAVGTPRPGEILAPVPGAHGVLQLADVRLTPKMVEFLRVLRMKVPARYPITVTCGLLSSRAQAHKLLDGPSLRGSYKTGFGPEIVEHLLGGSRSVQRYSSILLEYKREGKYLTHYLRGGAVDLRGTSSEGRLAILTAVRDMGPRAVFHGDLVEVTHLTRKS